MQIESLMQINQAKLSPLDWQIYDYISKNPGSKLTLEDIAKQNHVSTTTVFRFCKKLGLTGFGELRALLKNQQQDIVNEVDFQKTYHAIVSTIAGYDTYLMFKRLQKAQDIYLLARSELELRLAKEFQRIFFPLGKRIFILPNDQALKKTLSQINGQILLILAIDSNKEYPSELRTDKYLADSYRLVLSEVEYVAVLADEQILLPVPKEFSVHKIVTPYVLALELLYLKLQLS